MICQYQHLYCWVVGLSARYKISTYLLMVKMGLGSTRTKGCVFFRIFSLMDWFGTVSVDVCCEFGVM